MLDLKTGGGGAGGPSWMIDRRIIDASMAPEIFGTGSERVKQMIK